MPVQPLQTQIAEASGFMEALDVDELRVLLNRAFIDDESAAKWLAEVEPEFKRTPISLLKYNGDLGCMRVLDHLRNMPARQRR